jgi:hypothetical protein
VFADPIRQVQEEFYAQLLALRDGFAQTLTLACDAAESKPQVGSSEEVEKLRAENKKLLYRIDHLKLAVDEAANDKSNEKLEAENKKLLYRIEHLKKAAFCRE